MKIVKYDKEAQALYVRFNTHVVWRYSPVDRLTFDYITESKHPEKSMKVIFRDPAIVGTYKEENSNDAI
jgi:hypothetical protein